MALKAIIDSIDSVAEGVRGEYEEITDGEQTGKFRLKVEGADALVDVSGYKTTIKKLRTDAELVSQLLKDHPDLSKDEIRELVKTAKGGRKPEGSEGGDKPDLEKLRKQVEDQLTTKYKPIVDEHTQLKAENRALKLDAKLEKMALDAGVMPERVGDAIALTKAQHDLDDKGRIVMLDEDGELSAITSEQFWKEKLKAEKPWLYKAPESSGAGGGRGGDKKGGSAGTVRSKKDLKTDRDKANFISDHSYAAYRDLPNE